MPAGVPVTFTATVSETTGSGALSGTVSFTKGNAKVSSCTNLSVSNDKAKCTITFPAVGNFNITATYPNDPFFLESSGSVLEQVVTANTPVFTSASDTTAAVGAAVQLHRERQWKPRAEHHRVRRAAFGRDLPGRTGGIGNDLGYRRGRDRWRLPPHPQGHQ